MNKPVAKPVTVEEFPDAPEQALHTSVYEELRTRMITGKIMPGIGLSTRGLALELGVSQCRSAMR